VRSELFNAGTEWEQALAGPSVAAYAVRLLELHETLPTLIRSSERPELALQAAASDAKRSVNIENASAAEAMAERALIRLLTRTAGGGDSLSQLTPTQAAERFSAERGTAGEFVSDFLAELLGQYARYATAREAGRLTEGKQGMGVGETRRLTQQVAEAAAEIGARLTVERATPRTVQRRWPSIVAAAFTEGRQLPGSAL
jgi:hypothetical protein